MRVTVEKIIYPGRSLAKHKTKAILTDEGIPDERIEVTALSEKAHYLQATTTQVHRPSPHRATPRCDHYRACSPYQYIEYPFQLETKRRQVEEIFFSGLKTDLPGLTLRASPEAWRYRNKIRLHIIKDKGGPFLAYHLPGSLSQFIKVEHCHLISDQVNALLGDLIAAVRKHNLHRIHEVAVRESSQGDQLLLILYCDYIAKAHKIIKSLGRLKKAFPLRGIVFINRKAPHKRFIWKEDFIEETLGGIGISIGAESFFQVNTRLLKTLIADIKKYSCLTGKETVADLYCGLGTFGISLARRASKIVGIELSPENVSFLNKNLERNKIDNFEVFEGNCRKLLPRILKKNKIDVFIVDPPRKGLDKEICRIITKSSARSILYISCNPSTLVRDLKMLPEYKLKHYGLYDFFAQTPHIEMLAVLER